VPAGADVRVLGPGPPPHRARGAGALRTALYLPAVVAMRANPARRAFAERLRAAGKCPKVVVVAVMRKLLELAWTLLRSGQPFSVSQGTPASTP
jgi:transposase